MTPSRKADPVNRALSLLAPLALLALAACETANRPYAPVENVVYSALGHDPFWLLTIGDDRIVLTLGPAGGRADGELATYSWPRVLPNETDGVMRWRSADGAGTIEIEARPGPCRGGDGARFADQVRIALPDRRLEGCGGRMLTGRRG